MLDRLTPPQQGMLWNNLEVFMENNDGTMSFGCMFAGSDLIVGVLQVFSELAEETFSLKPVFKQHFCIEKD